MEEIIKLRKEDVLAAYKAAREARENEILKLMEGLFGKDIFKPKDVMERIKTFEDAVQELGNKHPLVREWSLGDNFSKDLEAYLKLRIICAALNEGWKPQFTNDKYRYYLRFFSFSKEEFEMMTKDERISAIGSAFAKIIAHGDRVYIIETHALSGFNTGNGSQLALKSEELAAYCGEQFIDIWIDFVG